MVDAADLKSASPIESGGSSPFLGTIYFSCTIFLCISQKLDF